MARLAAAPALSPSSLGWLAATDPADRKRHGQYLTPEPVADALVSSVRPKPGLRVLDPGVGTGEILAAVARRFPDAELTGWDIDAGALRAARELLPGAVLQQRSALDLAAPDTPGRPEFDLVIGNPPYFQIPVTPGLKRRFGDVISGRANIFALFFKVGLELLADGGTLAFVVPPSMNSGAYFEALRDHIVSQAAIVDLTVLDGSGHFEGANTAAQLLVLEKGARGGGFVFEHSQPEAGFHRLVFTRSPADMADGFYGRRTLWQLGFEAATGTVVWNQHRSDLRREPGDGTFPLIWSRDLRGGTFDPAGRPGAATPDKPGYISSDRPLTGPALLVNRVIGAVGHGELRTSLIPAGVEFLAENHVNVVRTRKTDPAEPEPNRPGWPELQAAFEAPGTGDRARLLAGNTQLSATELTHMLPS